MASRETDDAMLIYGGSSLDQVIEELKRVKRDNCSPEEIDRLINKVSHMNAVMIDAEKKQPFTSQVDRFLFKKTKQVLLDAEDLLDELATDVAVLKMRGRTEKSAWSKVTTQTRDRILKMKDRLVDVAQHIAMSGLQTTARGDDVRLELLPTWRQTGSLFPFGHRIIIGRDSEKEEIKKQLFSSTPLAQSNRNGAVFSVLPIIGMGGMGKTTLARLVFNDPDVKKQFDLMMWVCVSNNPDPQRLTKEMIESALSFNGKQQSSEIKNWDTMQQTLKREIEGKRFLLVLDDVWEAKPSMWEKLLLPLYYGESGSRVFVTSRSKNFVENIEAEVDPAILLPGLSDDDIWDILKSYCDISYLEGMKKGFCSRLKGSPLAAKTIGSLLNSIQKQEWRTVLESPLWKLKQEEDDILPSLQLSFQYLSPDLKQCFAYCSLFPKDHRIPKEKIAETWDALSFSTKKSKDGKMKMMGRDNLDKLLRMSLFDPVPEGGREPVKNVVMHDLIHDLAEDVSVGDCLRLCAPTEIPHQVTRHVSVVLPRALTEFEMLVDKLCGLEKLRSLVFVRVSWLTYMYPLDRLFEKLKMLRVLDFGNFCVRVLPKSIGNLKHLRYLGLEGNDELSRCQRHSEIYTTCRS